MSRFHGNDWECPGCGVKYRNFRTGYSYYDVYLMIDGLNPSVWTYKRRGTVLGKWHAMKLELWERHIEECFQTHTGSIPFYDEIEGEEDVPF